MKQNDDAFTILPAHRPFLYLHSTKSTHASPWSRADEAKSLRCLSEEPIVCRSKPDAASSQGRTAAPSARDKGNRRSRGNAGCPRQAGTCSRQGARPGVHVHVQKKDRWRCPVYGRKCHVHDYLSEESSWRGMDFRPVMVRLGARVPRVCCGEHGVLTAAVP